MGAIAGKYDVVTGTYGAGPDVTVTTSLGQTELNSVNLEYVGLEEEIRGDNQGLSIQDAVYRGANCYLDLTLLQPDRTNVLAGPHTLTYGIDAAEADLGETEGIDVEWVMHAEMFAGDNLGASIQDGIYQGADVFVQTTLRNFNKQAYQSFKAYWPWGLDHVTPANQVLQLGKLHKAGASDMPVGRLASNTGVSRSLILTGVAGAPAGGNVLDFHNVKLANGYPVRLLMAPSLRRVPIRFQVYPSATKWFTVSGGAAVADVAWPWNATWGNVGTIGVLLSSLAKGIKLTALAGTPASMATGPLKIVAKLAVLAPAFPVRLSFTPTLRRLRLRLQLLPYASVGDADQYVHFEPLMA